MEKGKAMSRYTDIDAFERTIVVSVISEIDKAPTIDIVRCKECKHHFYDELNDCKMCHIHEYGEIWEDDDYCSYGERGGE